MSKAPKMAVWAWLLVLLYYFYQYALRSAPSVMIPQLSQSFGLSALGVASIAGLFYYGYSPFSLITGVSLDRLGLRSVIPLGAVAVGAGSILFASGDTTLAGVGRLLQGAGGAVPLVGAVYIVSKYFPAAKAATLIGATQMFGMAGGFAGQFAVGPVIGGGVPWQRVWIISGVAGILLGLVLWVFLPKETGHEARGSSFGSTVNGFKAVVANRQSLLCGFIAALLFIPTTIFDMVWGVRFLQDGYGLDYGQAVLRSSAVPFGWIIGCPLLGYLSDRIGRRKPVIVGGAAAVLLCLTFALFGRVDVFPRYSIALLIGVASGAAMIPYTVIKEANPPHLSGTATGVANFINFTFSAVMGQALGLLLVNVSHGSVRLLLRDYRLTFGSLIFGVTLAVVMTFFLKETGPSSGKNGS